ncbi:MAG: ABC transporter substrate-binding protein [Enterobacteriaceae bacterium]
MTSFNSAKSAIALLLAACGLSAGAMAAQVPAGVELAAKQELVRNNGAEPESLDPAKIEGTPGGNIVLDLMEGLVQLDNNGKTIPGIAERWENQDFKVWTFHLRPDAKWSNGDPVTAADFVYAWQRAIDPATASPYGTYFVQAHVVNADDIISGQKKPDALGVKALDAHTLEVTLSSPVPYFYKMLQHYTTYPVPKAAIEKYGNKWTQPGNYISNGAYTLAEWVVNEKIVLKRNPLYWDNKHTVIEQITWLPIESATTDVNRYRSGEIDITNYTLPVDLFQKLKKERPDEVYSIPSLCNYNYEINNKEPLFQDVRVRRALKLALGRDILTNKVKNQGDIVSYGFTPPYVDGIGNLPVPEWSKLSQVQLDEEAQKLLQEAGYSKDKPLKLKLLYNNADLHQKLGIAAVSTWKKNTGGMVEVQLQNQEWKTYLESRRLGNYQLARAGWCADYNEPSSFLNYFLSTSSNNTTFYKNKQYDQLLGTALTAKTDEERAVIYQQAEAMLDRDSVIIPVYYQTYPRLIKPWVKGVTKNNPMNQIKTKDLYILKH